MREFDFMTVKFLLFNSPPLIQPKGQVTSNFKNYTTALFQRRFEVMSNTELTLREFWKHHFNIVHSQSLIVKVWQEVSQRTVNSAWRNFVGIFEESSVSLGMYMGLDVCDGDVEELLEGPMEELRSDRNRSSMKIRLKLMHSFQTQED